MVATGKDLPILAVGGHPAARRCWSTSPASTRTAPTTRRWPRPSPPRRPRSAGSGRVLLRPSGTEPLVRVMVEAPTDETARDVADRLADVVRDRLTLA